MTVLSQVIPMVAENSLFKAVGDIFHPLFELVATVLAFIYGVIPNYALAIILLTILIMVLLTPLTIKSTKSMLAMQALQPELQKLRQKYKGAENREQLNQEMMRLYREQGVSPTGGCLPMFLQMPALIVLYDVIRGLANTIKKGTVFPTGTVLRSGAITKAGQKCAQKVCAVPRYIPTTSKMYHNLVKTPGVMKAFGLNLASKPLTHHANWLDYIPYFAMVAVAVALQYIQMNQMTKRNKAAAQMNPQMQTMQKIMPLIFAYIYFLIPAGVVVYMVVSSAIRILTQDLIFRSGIVQGPAEREIGAGAKNARKGSPSPTVGQDTATPAAGSAPPAEKIGGGTAGSGTKRSAPSKTGAQRTGSARTARPGGANGSGAKGSAKGGTNGATIGATDSKPHPRSKSKRARKAR
jgi:YidC/Oxa1 family membrane protein insertase